MTLTTRKLKKINNAAGDTYVPSAKQDILAIIPDDILDKLNTSQCIALMAAMNAQYYKGKAKERADMAEFVGCKPDDLYPAIGKLIEDR